MKLKEEVYKKCLEVVDGKISYLQGILKDLTASAANETKSTAGDKHETALAMLQIEQENTSRQLRDALDNRAALLKINIDAKPFQAITGSLLKTSNGYFFLSVGIGKILVDKEKIIALSAESPLGSKLRGLLEGSSADFNGTSYLVQAIY